MYWCIQWPEEHPFEVYSLTRNVLFNCLGSFCLWYLLTLPSTIHFLIAYSMRKWRGKVWSILGEGVEAEVPDYKNELQDSCSFCPKHRSFKCSLSKNCNQGPLTPSVYQGIDHWHHSCDKMDQNFPSIFGYCKWSKTGQWEGLKMRVSSTVVVNDCHFMHVDQSCQL